MNGPLFEGAADDAPVLVVVMNNADDLARARTEHWYRIPLAHAPRRIGAEFLAFYQTGAFGEDERWCVRWAAAVRGYRLATRRELIPEEPDHPRADARYYRVALGDLFPLLHPIPSRRLRRITFIHTTAKLLCEAQEINDLWRQTPSQARLWQALQQAGLADQVEREYPLLDDLSYATDFAVFAGDTPTAIMLLDPTAEGDGVREAPSLDYPLARGGWRPLYVDAADPASVAACIRTLMELQRRAL